MKKLVILVALLVGSFAFGQVSKVRVVEHKGITTAQRDALTTTGVYPVIYNTTTGQFERWNGSAWEAWGAGGGGGTWGSITGTLSNQTDLQSALDLKANLAGATFSADISVPDEAYTVAWNGSLEVPTKNAVYDQIEAIVLGGGSTDDQNISGSGLAGTNLTIGIENGASEIVDLSSLVGTDDQTAAEVSIADAGALITATDVEGALAENRTAINLNTAKVTNATHTGEVTGSGALTIASGVVDSDNIVNGTIQAVDIEATNSPTDGYVMTYDSATGGFTFEAGAGGGTDDQTASEVNITDAGGNYTATTVEDALAEIFAETVKVDAASPIQTIALALADTEAELTGLGANTIGFSKDGGTTLTASGIANVPSGNLVATDVQAALNELQTELDGVGGSGDDVSTFSEKTGALVGTDRLVGLSGATDFSETISGIPLSIFNDDLTHTTDTNLSQEEVEDFVGGLVSSAGDGLVYSDAGGTLSVVDSEITITESQISDLAHTTTVAGISDLDNDAATLTIGPSASVSGINTGNQTSIVGITGTAAEFDTAITDDDIVTLGRIQTLTGNKTFSGQATFSNTTELPIGVYTLGTGTDVGNNVSSYYSLYDSNFSESGRIGFSGDEDFELRNVRATGGQTEFALRSDGSFDFSGGEVDLNTGSIGGTAQTATGDGTTTIDWGNGNLFNFQFGAFNEVFTFTAPTNPGTFILKLVQDSVGSRTATWPASVQWPGGTAPTLTTTATTGTDIITFYYDGTDYFAVSSLDFQ